MMPIFVGRGVQGTMVQFTQGKGSKNSRKLSGRSSSGGVFSTWHSEHVVHVHDVGVLCRRGLAGG
jgi:hypothetical protein